MNSDYGNFANNWAWGTSLRIEHDLDWAKLVSITSYDVFRRAQTEDADNSPYSTVNDNYYSYIKQTSQELRLSGKAGRLIFLVGGYFENDNLTEYDISNFSQNPIVTPPAFASNFVTDFNQRVRSLALFTHNEYELSSNLSVVVGARYTSDRTRLNGSTSLGANDRSGVENRVTAVIPVDAAATSRTDNTFSFRGGLNWKFKPDNMLYTSVSRGFRSGGYSVPVAGVITTFNPEQLTAYEIGYKGRFLDHTLDLDVAGFYYDYKDLQIRVNDPASPVVPITRNIGKARTLGAEANLLWRPDPSFTASLGVGFLDSKLTQSSNVVTTYAGVIPLQGKPLINAPHWTFQGSLQKSFSLGSDHNLIAGTDFKYVGPRYLGPTGQVFDRASAYWVQNARLAISSADGRYEVALWGKNLFNGKVLNYLNNINFFRIEIYNEPRSYGISTSLKF